jgi:hypothetical protein
MFLLIFFYLQVKNYYKHKAQKRDWHDYRETVPKIRLNKRTVKISLNKKTFEFCFFLEYRVKTLYGIIQNNAHNIYYYSFIGI